MNAQEISWYTEPKYWPAILVIVHLWKTFGYNCVLYYAVLVGIDRGYYEAAAIDGAGRWQQIVKITLPSLVPTIIVLTLMSIGKIFYSDFGLFYQVPMDSGPLYDVTNTIDTYVYRGLIRLNNIGMSSAAGFYQSVGGFSGIDRIRLDQSFLHPVIHLLCQFPILIRLIEIHHRGLLGHIG